MSADPGLDAPETGPETKDGRPADAPSPADPPRTGASSEPPSSPFTAPQAPRPPPMSGGSSGGEIGRAGRGLLAVIRGDPAWTSRFDLTATGFLRSFLGPILALPFYVFGSALVTRALMNGRLVADDVLWGAALAHGIDAVGFPLLIALIARPLKIDAGYPAFIVVINWASLYLNILLAAASLLALAGHDGLEAFSLVTLVLLCLSVFFVWRAGRMTLSREAAPVLLVVVLSVAVSAAADQAVQFIT